MSKRHSVTANSFHDMIQDLKLQSLHTVGLKKKDFSPEFLRIALALVALYEPLLEPMTLPLDILKENNGINPYVFLFYYEPTKIKKLYSFIQQSLSLLKKGQFRAENVRYSRKLI